MNFTVNLKPEKENTDAPFWQKLLLWVLVLFWPCCALLLEGLK